MSDWPEHFGTLKEEYEPPKEACDLCRRRGKTWDGGDPACAFLRGEFDGENWNCATMNELRGIAETSFGARLRCSDNSIGIVPMRDGGFLVMTWYKERGRTADARVVWASLHDTGSLNVEEAVALVLEYSTPSEPTP